MTFTDITVVPVSSDRGTAAATTDPRVLATLDEDPVFDGRRLIAASFEIAMDLQGD